MWPKKYKTIWDLLSRFPDTLQKLVSTELNNVLGRIGRIYSVYAM